MRERALVIDANILIRGTLGPRVRTLLGTNAGTMVFLAPQTVPDEAREHLEELIVSRRLERVATMAVLEELLLPVQIVGEEGYTAWRNEARARLRTRDMDDWPVLALALTVGCPIWTEDRDFFGAGVATWTTDRVDRFFAGVPQAGGGSPGPR